MAKEKALNVKAQIKAYLTSLPELKRSELRSLHKLTLQISPTAKLWFSDGKNETGKVVANPSIGYGFYTIKYADGSTREFYRVGLSVNTTGISVYIMGLTDKTYLIKTFGKKLGKATVTGYCIRFETLNDINVDVLEAAIQYGLDVKHG